MSKPIADLPDWERLLSAAARLQAIIPGTVLVGGTAAAVHAEQRLSMDDDHVLGDLRERFASVLSQLEAVAGWRTARTARPVLILGSLDGIDTGVRQLIRSEPLETEVIERFGVPLTIPTSAEMLRIKAILILKRNATRDYVDFAALAERAGVAAAAEALRALDDLYPQQSGESPLQQLHAQLSEAIPFDLEETVLSEYKNLDPRWHDWVAVKTACIRTSIAVFDRLCDSREPTGP